MGKVINIRCSEEDYARWHRVAAERKMTLSGLLRVSVDQYLSNRSPKVFASQVAEELAPQLIAELVRRERLAPEPPNPISDFPPSGPVTSYAVFEPAMRVFDPQCDNVDVHYIGTVCGICGGSLYQIPPRPAGGVPPESP